METTGIYIKSDFLSQMSKKDTIIFFQIMRLLNALEFWLELFVKIPKEQNKVFEERNRIELYFLLSGFYKESTKEFCNNLADGLLGMNLSKDVNLKVSKYKAWLENWKQDEYLQVVHRMRNSLRFHIKSDIYKKYIKDGNESEDLLVGIFDGERHVDYIFTEPYTFEFAHIAEIVPDSVGENTAEKINWVTDKLQEETIRFVKLLREIIRELFKGNSYKKPFEF